MSRPGRGSSTRPFKTPWSGRSQTTKLSRLSAIFENVALDDRILAVGLCNDSGRLVSPTKLMPATFSCDKVARSEAESFSTIFNDGRRILVGAFPIVERNQKAYLVILHDLSFIDARSGRGPGLRGRRAGRSRDSRSPALPSVFVIVILRGWMTSLRRAVEEVRSGAISSPPARDRSADRRPDQEAARRNRSRPRDDRLQTNRLVTGRAAGTAAQGAAGRRGARHLQPRAIYSQSRKRQDFPADTGQRPGIRARAGDSGMRRNLDRSRQRKRRPGDGRPRRQDSRSAGRACPTRCGESGSRTRSRTATITALPTKVSGRCATLHSCGRSFAKPTGGNTKRSTSGSPMPWSRRPGPRIRSFWSRTTTSRLRPG